jgi:hypothetical protein
MVSAALNAAQSAIERRPIIFLGLFAAWFTFEHFAFGPWSYTPLFDEGNSIFPFRLLQGRELLANFGSLWSPHHVAGVDKLASALGPKMDSILFAVLPGWLAYGINKFLVEFVAGASLFLLLRRHVGISFWPSVTAAILFTGETYFFAVGFVFAERFAVAGLPLVLYVVARQAAGSARGIVVTVTAGIVYALNSNLTYFSAVVVPTVFLWLFFFDRRGFRDSLILSAAFIGGVLLIEWQSLWATFANAPLSQRQGHVVAYGGLSEHLDALRSYITLPVILPLMTATAAIMSGELVRPELRRRVIVTISIAVLLLAAPHIWMVLATLLPEQLHYLRGSSLKFGITPRIWLVVAFAVAADALTTIGEVDPSSSRSRVFGRKLGKAAIIFGLATTLAGSAIVKPKRLWDMIHAENFSYLYAHPDLIRLAERQRNAEPFRVATPFILSDTGFVEPSYLLAYGFETVDGYANLYSMRYKDFWRMVIARLEAENPVRFAEFTSWGNRIYLFGAPNDWGPPCADGTAACAVPFERYYNVDLLALANVMFVVSARPLASNSLELVPSDTRDSLMVWQRRRMRDKIFAKVTGTYIGPALYVYRNRNALPRFFVVSKIEALDDDRQVLAKLATLRLGDLASRILAKKSDLPSEVLVINGDAKGSVRVIRYSADRIELSVDSSQSALLAIMNVFSPFWKATVNGSATTIFPAYHAFQGIVIPAGRSSVVLKYVPPYAMVWP